MNTLLGRAGWFFRAVAYELAVRGPDWPGFRAAHNWAAGVAWSLDTSRFRLW